MPSSNGLPLALVVSQCVRDGLSRRTIPIALCIRRFSTSPSPFAGQARGRKAAQEVVGKEDQQVQIHPEKLSEIPDDIEYQSVLIPPTRKGTPDMPTLWNNPRWLKSLIGLRYELRVNRLQDFAISHPQFHLVQKDLERHALSLYKEMNEAFAEGPKPKAIAKIEQLCGESYAKSLTTAMKELVPKTKRSWTWKKTLSKPKLISFGIGSILRGQPESDLVQAVIRIHGSEALDDGVSEPKSQESYTYIALQLKMWVRPVNWLIVGRIQETPVSVIVEKIEKQKEARAEQKRIARGAAPPGFFRRISFFELGDILRPQDSESKKRCGKFGRPFSDSRILARME